MRIVMCRRSLGQSSNAANCGRQPTEERPRNSGGDDVVGGFTGSQAGNVYHDGQPQFTWKESSWLAGESCLEQ